MTSKTNCWLRYSPCEKSDQQIYCDFIPFRWNWPHGPFQSSIADIYLLYRTPCTIKRGNNLKYFKRISLRALQDGHSITVVTWAQTLHSGSNHWSESLLFNMVAFFFFLTHQVIFLCSNPFPRLCKVFGKSLMRGDLPQMRPLHPKSGKMLKFISHYSLTCLELSFMESTFLKD